MRVTSITALGSHRRLRAILCAAGLAALLPAGAAAQQRPAGAAAVTVAGMVADSVTGQGILGATVTFRTARRVAFTDSLGRFLVTRALAGAEQVEVRQIGYRTRTLPLDVHPDASPLLIRLPPDPVPLRAITARASRKGRYTIEGTVVDSATGRPVRDAVLWFQRSRGSAVTDGLGHYIYDRARSGPEQVTIDVLGYYPRRLDPTIAEPWQRLNVALVPDPLVARGLIGFARQLRHGGVRERGFRQFFSERQLAESHLRTPADFLQWAQAFGPPGKGAMAYSGILSATARPKWGGVAVEGGPVPEFGILARAGISEMFRSVPRRATTVILNNSPLQGGDEAKLAAALTDFYQAVVIRDFHGNRPTVVLVFTKSYLRQALGGSGMGRLVVRDTLQQIRLSADSLDAIFAALDSLR